MHGLLRADFTLPPRAQRGRWLLAAAAAAGGVTIEKLIAMPNRNKAHVRLRMALIYILRHEYGWTFPRIGRLINRDHSSVWYGYHQAEKLKVKDEAWARMAMNLWLATRDAA